MVVSGWLDSTVVVVVVSGWLCNTVVVVEDREERVIVLAARAFVRGAVDSVVVVVLGCVVVVVDDWGALIGLPASLRSMWETK